MQANTHTLELRIRKKTIYNSTRKYTRKQPRVYNLRHLFATSEDISSESDQSDSSATMPHSEDIQKLTDDLAKMNAYITDMMAM